MATELVDIKRNISDGIEVAQITVPKILVRYAQKPKRSLLDRLLARPGPKPFLSEITYRGKDAPMLSRFMQKVGEFRTDSISLNTYDLMRKHPMVKLGTVIKAAPILTALREARVKCDDDRIAAFIKTVFVEPWLLRVAETSIMPSYVFGVAPHEKVWENKQVRAVYTDDDGNEKVAWDGTAMVYKKIKFVHPISVERFLVQEKTQDYAGFVQYTPPGEEEKPIEAWKSFTCVNRFIYGGLWGESEYGDIYPYWYYSEFFRALLADYLRYKAVPPIIGYAPMEQRQNQDGTEVDAIAWTGEVLQKAYDNMVIVLPSEYDERGNQRFKYEELRVSERAEIFTRALEDLDVLILRGLVVPERTVTQDRAAVGSYNQASVHQERMLDAAKMETDSFLRDVNAYLVPQLVEDHFGPNAPKCEIYAHSVSEELKAKLQSVVVTILQNDRFALFSQQIAFRDLLDFLNIPYTTGENAMPIPQIGGETQPKEDQPEKEETKNS